MVELLQVAELGIISTGRFLSRDTRISSCSTSSHTFVISAGNTHELDSMTNIASYNHTDIIIIHMCEYGVGEGLV